MDKPDAATALRRFGLGPRPGELRRISSDPRGFVTAQLARSRDVRVDDPALSAGAASLTSLREARIARKEAREQAVDAAGRMNDAGATMSPPATMSDKAATPARQGQASKPGQIRREVFAEEMIARINHATATDAAFLERLVMFWSSHLCVSAAKGAVRVVAGAYEREAIRPHVLGSFADMLKASVQHPAMLIYLDNAQSIGPNSIAGRNRGRGLNENLAREILELHTLGVDGGYTQADVTNLARIITGWTVAGTKEARAEPGSFMFAPNRHEPGAWTVMGRRYENGSVNSGEACLADLARHPSTARHIATKLARHFVSEGAASSLAARMERTFRDSDGDLKEVARTLVASKEAWSAPPRKLVPPYDFAVSLMRGFSLKAPPGEVARLASALGQPLWHPPSPKGWPDDDNAWMGPSAVRERLRIAERLARDIDKLADPRAMAEDLLGPALSEPTRQAVARAETREQGFQLMIMSPEFLRR